MSKIITNTEVEQFKKDGAVLIKGKFDNAWLEKLKKVIKKAKERLSPRFVNHNKDNYEFLQWDLEVGDCIYFDIRTLHGGLNTITPKKDVHRYTLRMAKENSKIIYRGDWARQERAIMEDNGYKNGDDLSGKMFPTLFEAN